MPIKLLTNDITSAPGLRTIGLEADGWPRIIIILNEEDGVQIKENPNNPLELVLIRRPGVNKT